MQVASFSSLWHCGVMIKLQVLLACFMNLKVGGSNPLLIAGCFFITPRSCMVFCKTFYTQEMVRIYPPNAHNSECQIFYFLTFSAERSKFLERTLPPHLIALTHLLIFMIISSVISCTGILHNYWYLPNYKQGKLCNVHTGFSAWIWLQFTHLCVSHKFMY